LGKKRFYWKLIGGHVSSMETGVTLTPLLECSLCVTVVQFRHIFQRLAPTAQAISTILTLTDNTYPFTFQGAFLPLPNTSSPHPSSPSPSPRSNTGTAQNLPLISTCSFSTFRLRSKLATASVSACAAVHAAIQDGHRGLQVILAKCASSNERSHK